MPNLTYLPFDVVLVQDLPLSKCEAESAKMKTMNMPPTTFLAMARSDGSMAQVRHGGWLRKRGKTHNGAEKRIMSAKTTHRMKKCSQEVMMKW